MLTNPLNFRYQIEQLIQLRQPELSVLCKKLERPVSGNKIQLISRIINAYFYISIQTAATDQIRNQLSQQVHIVYERLLETIHIDTNITIGLIQMLDTWYWYTYGLMRNGTTLEEYSQEIQRLYGNNRNKLQITLVVQPKDEKEEKDEEQEKDEKEKDETEKEDEDCVICYEAIKQTCKLGCGHKFCSDCIIKTAQAKKAPHISCALCREEIKVISVETEIAREQLSVALSLH